MRLRLDTYSLYILILFATMRVQAKYSLIDSPFFICRISHSHWRAWSCAHFTL